MDGIMWKDTRGISSDRLVVWDGIGKSGFKMTSDARQEQCLKFLNEPER